MRKKTADPAKIRLLVLDVDGVLTDGRLYYSAEGETLKVFNVRDGYGIRNLAAAGVEIAVITGRRSEAVAERCRDLGIRHVSQGIQDKLARLNVILKRLAIPASECAVVGDDTIDVEMMQVAGIAFTVADAHPDARRAADVVTRLAGGHGAVREICDQLLAARQRKRRKR
jgi:3-deoxy-D-manno-octulosonate 8-phosphate phosphatase (KDO 8-P phosphatase)